MDDAALVDAIRTGDGAAFGELYDRYADRLHGFCYSVLRDRDDAADATQDTFLLAADKLHQLRDPARLRPWLYAIARHVSFRRIEQRKRAVAVEEVPDAGVEVDMESTMTRDEASSLVWEAAAALNDRDRALLDLHLRHGLEGADLAAAIGESTRNPYSLVNRLKEQLETAVSALIVARWGRKDCSTLDALLTKSGFAGELTPLVRKRVARHIEGCDTCSETRSQRATGTALFSAAPLVTADAALRSRVLSQLGISPASTKADSASPSEPGSPPATQQSTSTAQPGASTAKDPSSGIELPSRLTALAAHWRGDGFPPTSTCRRYLPGRRLTAAAAVLLALALLVGLVALREGNSADTAGASLDTAPSTTAARSTTTSTATTTGSPTTQVPLPSAVPPVITDPPATASPPPPTTAAPPTTIIITTTTGPDVTPPVIKKVSLDPITICPTSTVIVRTTTTDDRPGVSATAEAFVVDDSDAALSDDAGRQGAMAMTLVDEESGAFDVTLGPWSTAPSQIARVKVRATDAAGNRSPRVEVRLVLSTTACVL